MSEPLSKMYVGDGVYAEFSDYDVKLYTQEGNEIYLEYDMLKQLMRTYDRLVELNEKPKESENE